MSIEYTLIRSKRKTVSIQVALDKTVIVRAPMRLPQREIERIVLSKQGWIEAHLAAAVPRPVYTPEETEALREAARETIPRRVAYFAAKMGLEPASVKITSAKTRYGSCSSRHRLCFSLYLMAKPPEAVDYVVVHELAHMVELNHSAAFYRVIEAVLPDYKERAKLLK